MESLLGTEGKQRRRGVGRHHSASAGICSQQSVPHLLYRIFRSAVVEWSFFYKGQLPGSLHGPGAALSKH